MNITLIPNIYVICYFLDIIIKNILFLQTKYINIWQFKIFKSEILGILILLTA